MARFEFKLPDVGEGVAEAEIVEWRVKPGERVEEDQPFLDVMTDKATVEITSPVAGKVVSLEGGPGMMTPVGAVVAVLETDGEGADEPALAPEPAPSPEFNSSPVSREADQSSSPGQSGGGGAERAGGGVSSAPSPSRSAPRHALAAPAVRKRAAELGIDLASLNGSGPEGRVVHHDLDALLARRSPAVAPAAAAVPRPPAEDGVEVVKVIGLRRRIAEKMARSKARIPHFAYVEEVDVTDLEDLRARLNARPDGRPRLTVLPFVARAMVKAAAEFPQMNALYDDEAGEVRRCKAVHLGVAAQTPAGLMAPVVRHAEALDLWGLAEAVKRLGDAAKAGKAPAEDLSGSTITLTSLGALGGLASTPVINWPEVAIVGPNRIIERPAYGPGGVLGPRKLMNLSSSFDHRVVDGADAAAFIQSIKALLEAPALLLLPD